MLYQKVVSEEVAMPGHGVAQRGDLEEETGTLCYPGSQATPEAAQSSFVCACVLCCCFCLEYLALHFYMEYCIYSMIEPKLFSAFPIFTIYP